MREEERERHNHRQQGSSNEVRDDKRKNLVKYMKEKERMRRALLSCARTLVSFEFLE